MIHSDAPAWHSQAMQLRLPFLLGALAAAAIAVSPAHAASAAGCTSTKPAAAGTTKPSFKKPGTVLARNRRYAIVMTTNCGAIRIVLDRKLGGPDPQLDRLPRHEALLRRADIPARRPGLRAAGRRSARRRHGRAGLSRSSAHCPGRIATSSETSRWPRRPARPRARRARSSSSSPAPAACNCPRITVCSAMRPTRPRSPRSGASRRSPRRPAATRRGVLRRRRSGSPRARLVTLP